MTLIIQPTGNAKAKSQKEEIKGDLFTLADAVLPLYQSLPGQVKADALSNLSDLGNWNSATAADQREAVAVAVLLCAVACGYVVRKVDGE